MAIYLGLSPLPEEYMGKKLRVLSFPSTVYCLSRIVMSFETAIADLTARDNFTNLTVVGDNTALSVERVSKVFTQH